MFKTYNLDTFAIALKELRASCKLTQSDVSKLSGINIDTLRKIENGKVTPRYETLELLSIVYKRDLLLLLTSHREHQELKSLYTSIDEIIVTGNTKKLKDISLELESINTNDLSINLVDKTQINQLMIFINEAYNYFNPNYKFYSKSISILKNLLSSNVSDFSFNNLTTKKFNFIELRILMLISLFLIKIDDISKSTSILTYSLESLKLEPLNSSENIRLIIKLYLNISYNNHLLNNHGEAFKYANLGIEFAVQNDTLYCLAQLYARKAIAEFHTSNSNYENSFLKSMHIFEILNYNELALHYKTVAKEKYNINI